jgi:hypothetical protein
MNPILLDNFFPTELYGRLRDAVRCAPMSYGSKSNSETDPHGHWSWKPIQDSTHNLADISGQFILPPGLLLRPLEDGWKLLSATQMDPGTAAPCWNMKLIRCYANGYTYGTDGYFHTDSVRSGDLTVIIFICDEWHRDWGGETVVDNGKTYWSYLPRPNRVLVIPSDMPHAARAVSRKCNKLRTTLMYKCRPPRSKAFEDQSAWLRDAGALKIAHDTGTLHDHLMRCHQLMVDKGDKFFIHREDNDLVRAAGLHSIYGTNAFTKQLLDPNPSNRAWVADRFGKEAEELAWLFHILDRPRTLDREVGELEVEVDYRFAGPRFIPNAKFRALRLIEAANLADQDSLKKYPILGAIWGGR